MIDVYAEQVIGVLKEHQAGASASDLCRKHGISDATFYMWRSKYSGLEVSNTRKLEGLEDENARLRRRLAESMLDVSTLKEMLAKTSDACGAAICRGLGDYREGLLPATRLRVGQSCPEDLPISIFACRRCRRAGQVAGAGLKATAVRLPAPAHTAGAGGRAAEP